MELITLDNYSTKMPAWDPSLNNHLYALVDMGSNGIRFSISDLSPPRSRLLRCLYRERAGISLFDALSRTPPGQPLRFPDETITRVSRLLSRFSTIATSYGVPREHVSVFATEAMRKSDNAASMLEAIYAASGLQVQVIAPEVETLFGAMGARSAYGQVKGLFLDLGGGSVQMSFIDTQLADYEIAAAQRGRSLPFGAARLIKILDSDDSNAQALAHNELSGGMLRAFTDLQREYPSLAATQTGVDSQGLDVYLCGGGFRGYGSMLMYDDPIQPYPIPAIGAYTVDGERFRDVEVLKEINATSNEKIFGMSKRRRQQFPAIAAVVEALINAVPSIRQVTFCSGGNREGALLLKLPREIRESNPLPLISHDQHILQQSAADAVIDTLRAAVPGEISGSIPSIFSLGLESIFVNRMWNHLGEFSESNAAFELHHSLGHEPSAPGYSHLARAVLSLTASARWGTKHAPVDQKLHHNLQKLVNRTHPEAAFWTEYIGAVAAGICTVVPVAPVDRETLTSVISIKSSLLGQDSAEKLAKLQLQVTLAEDVGQCLDPDELVDTIEQVGKKKKKSGFLIDRRKIDVIMRSF